MEQLLQQLLTQLAEQNLGTTLNDDQRSQLSGIIGQGQDIFNQNSGMTASRLGVSDMRDIDPFKVNPFRGYLSMNDGGMVPMVEDDQGMMFAVPYMAPSKQVTTSLPYPLPALGPVSMNANMRMGGAAGLFPTVQGRTVDTINNTPGNVSLNSGTYQLNDLFNFNEGGFTVDQFEGLYNLGTKRGRRKQKQLQRIINRANRGNPNAIAKLEGMQNQATLNNLEAQGYDIDLVNRRNQIYSATNPETGEVQQFDVDTRKGFGNRFWNSAKGFYDIPLTMLGAGDVIQNSFVDRSGALTGITNAIGSIAPMALNAVAPGLGSAVNMFGSTLNGLAGGQGMQIPGMGMNIPGFGVPNVNTNTSLYTPTGSLFDMLTNGGINPQSGGFASTMANLAQPTINNTGIGGALGMFEEGGPVSQMNMVPIQTERGEIVLHRDGAITDVNATKLHSQMSDDVVTDIVPEGTYIASNAKEFRMKRKDAENINIAIKATPYSELKKGKVPEVITLASIFGNQKQMTPADMARAVGRRYSTVDYEADGGYNDIFTLQTNQDNIAGRYPYLEQIIKYNEEMRQPEVEEVEDPLESFYHGGFIRSNIQHADGGGFMNYLPTIAQGIPLLTQLFGGNKRDGYSGNPGQIDPLSQSYMLGSFPLTSAGITQNIQAQMGALDQGIEDFSALGRQLIDNAGLSAQAQSQAAIGSLLTGTLGQLAQNTDLPRYNFDAQRTRLNNFQPASASRASFEALTTPQVNTAELARELGSRSGPALAQILSNQSMQRNQAIADRNRFLDDFEMNRIAQLNQLDMQQQQGNLPLEIQEMDRRNQITNNLTGLFGSTGQRFADIETGRLGAVNNAMSQILPQTTQFALQRAGLAGQDLLQQGQQMFNLGSTLGNIRNQNRAFASPPAAPAPTIPDPTTSSALSSFFSSVIPGISSSAATSSAATNRAEFEALAASLFGTPLSPLPSIPR